MRARHLLALVATMMPIGVVTAGCDSSGPPAAAPTTAASVDHSAVDRAVDHSAMTHTASMGDRDCEMHLPGEVLGEAQAMVVFDRESVCLGYVTVVAGTRVSWHNADTVAHSVTVVDDDGAELGALDVGPGEMSGFRTTDSGVLRFRLSALPSFVGTIEVQ